MATLTRPKTAPSPSTNAALLASEVPTPFPRELLGQSREVDQSSSNLRENNPISSQLAEIEQGFSHNDLLPSIAFVQKSCLMTLNNLLSVPTQWSPIVPDRRHSMPSTPQVSTVQHVGLDGSSSALHTLVSNLRNRQADEGMIELGQSENDSDLIRELRVRVESVSRSLQPRDAALVNALVSLLSHFDRLSAIQASSQKATLEVIRGVESSGILDAPPPIDLFDALKRQLNDLQVERLSSQADTLTPETPVLAVEAALLWSRIDEELEKVVSMCKERTETLPRFSPDHLPPQYDAAGYEMELPPDYEFDSDVELDDSKLRDATVPHVSTSSRHTDEKMRLDLEAVTMAIDRLYLVAPQLHDQRVELKSSKVAAMEKASREGGSITSSRSVSRGKGKEREVEDVKELENILDLLGKASERTMTDQSVVLDGGMQSRLEKARLRSKAKKEQFVEQLVRHSDSGRMHEQDAVLHPRIKDPEAMLTLPEFMEEYVPREVQRLRDPQAMLTLPEFVREPPLLQIHEMECDLPPFPTLKAKKKYRSRSLSAPPLSWFRPSLSRSSSHMNIAQAASASRNKSPLQTSFDVLYIAENHENLHHVLVFFTATGATPGVDVEAEVLAPFAGHEADGNDVLVIKSGTATSIPLMLPACTTPGKKEVRVQSGHYEIKLNTISQPKQASIAADEAPPLLGSSLLSSTTPTSFICASCSLPLIHSSKITTYRDLPSEHWEELVEAWMCHTDQKLHDHVVKHGKSGFWPQPGEALVGGSYILFDDSSMSRNNLSLAVPKNDDNWRITRCLCGAVVGRCQIKQTGDGADSIAYRILKYAIRPVSPNADPVKIPLSAFIVEDMNEFVQAHASYRFVIRDEEEELPRILVWLFKPRMRLAYTAPTSRAIPKSASVEAAKVLYKLIRPSEASADLKSLLNKYPGFPQAEYLSYPMAVCHNLAALLKESTSTYPDSLRQMTGLDVGWLCRS
ncbi:HECT-like ubiquitin-conjugating enzyme-binding-domain-containing protein [Cyathus striatus]|nr:HECT-like ubiquitin-conjugating enzyme-binding-domain-containing protein [Cyathus striatus]